LIMKQHRFYLCISSLILKQHRFYLCISSLIMKQHRCYLCISVFFTMAQQPPVGQGLLIIEDSWSHSDTPTQQEKVIAEVRESQPHVLLLSLFASTGQKYEYQVGQQVVGS
jgi:hypothetical protein